MDLLVNMDVQKEDAKLSPKTRMLLSSLDFWCYGKHVC
jgi:hypothetical protein